MPISPLIFESPWASSTTFFTNYGEYFEAMNSFNVPRYNIHIGSHIDFINGSKCSTNIPLTQSPLVVSLIPLTQDYLVCLTGIL
jgi:hypothetical protein